MEKSKVILVGFIYPQVEPYLKEYFKSIKNQTEKCFEILMVLDKFNKRIENYGYTGETLVAPVEYNIVEIRNWILEYLIKKGYELVIFLDSDDTMSENRIEKIIEIYKKTQKKYSFYYNDLFLMEEKTDFYCNLLPNNVEYIEEIEKYNFLGMSNTSINLKILKKYITELKKAKDTIAYDWYLHSILLLNKEKGIRVDTKTYYRIYDDNTAGKIVINEKRINFGIIVKEKHYFLLKKYDEIFEKNYNEIIKLKKNLEKKGEMKKYLEELNKKVANSVFWWDYIKDYKQMEELKMIKIKDKEIKNYGVPYIIAEIGANHNGDIELAKEMIKKAYECGADAVKFQSWTPKSLIAKEEYDRNQKYDDSAKKHFGSLKEMVEKYYLKEEQHFELKKYCDNLGVDFCSTPFSKEEVDLLMKLDVPFIKVASMDINNLELLKYIAKQGKTVILSTGMSKIGEIEKAVETIENEGNSNIVLLHCISIYPPKTEDIHLNNILMLQKAFKYPIGFSDHTFGTSIPLASIALGSCIVEKHFTLDKDLPGWDHEISADPCELKAICEEGKKINIALGNYERTLSSDEKSKLEKFRRSIVINGDLKKGDIIDIKNISFKRPGTGIRPDEVKYVIGRKLKTDKKDDELLKWEDME